ncbi:MAG: sigma-70 family RNA polymerase sigma factor [Acidobacteria bacterium]|nr:sigma-70 family RNA polymerase sigma factor [Acidobacteriota bacterium]
MKKSESLIELARRGDEEAFRLIFEQHHRLVLRFIYGMVGNLGQAEELTQETFLSAYRSLGSYLEEGKLAPWLCGIAKNVTRNWTRTRQNEIFNVELDKPEVLEVKDNINQTPEGDFLDGELNDKIRAALLRLDEDKRMVFTLKILQQLSYEEIAEVTGSTIPKLKTDLHRAKIEMRRLIRPYLEDNYEL